VIGCGSDEKNLHTLQVWDLFSGQCVQNFDHFSESVWSLAVSPDGKELLAGTGFGKIYRFDLQTGDFLEVWEGPSAEVSTLCFSPNGRYAFSGGSDSKLRVWEMGSGNCVHSSDTHKSWVNCIAVSPDGQRLLTGSSDLTLQLWALDWELENYKPAQWDDGALTYLEIFLWMHTPYAGQLSREQQPSEEEIRKYLTPEGKPTWTEEDFQNLLIELGHRGYGWLQSEGVRQKLEVFSEKRLR
jgi:WD40 repeat protein